MCVVAIAAVNFCSYVWNLNCNCVCVPNMVVILSSWKMLLVYGYLASMKDDNVM